METIFHTPIAVRTIAKNGSEKLGCVAECVFWKDGINLKIQVRQQGKSKLEAEEKLIRFLSENGKNNLELADEKESWR